MTKCKGCGIILQSKDCQKPGFIPKEKLKENLCERCFRLKNYNDLKEAKVLTNKEIIQKLNLKYHVFFLIDFLNINKEVIKTFKTIKNPKCLIISKIDYIPKKMSKEKITNWLKEVYQIKDDIIFLSTKNNYNTGALINYMENKNINTSYLIGYTNAGKSTLINKLTKSDVTISLMPNTTIGFIKIKLDNKYLIDTPGFNYKNSLLKTDKDLIKKINPKTYLKPITYQLKENSSVVIENLIRIENISHKCNMTIYISNLLKLEHIYSKNNRLKNLNIKEISIKKDEDIVLIGLGFINFKTNNKIRIYTQNKENIEIRKSIWRSNNE